MNKEINNNLNILNMNLIKIRISSKNKEKQFVRINNKVYRGFRIHELPNKFVTLDHENPIKNWFNYKGFTFINEDQLQSGWLEVDVLK